MIVADTGPLLRVAELRSPELLEPFAPIVVPRLVALECVRYELDLHSEIYEVRKGQPPKESLSLIEAEVRAGIIQPAEAEANAWALHDGADWLLTDDSNARTLSQRLGIPVHGSIGLILRNAQLATISKDRAHELLGGIASSSLWVSKAVLERALDVLEEIAQ